jgi:hypothetical protein
MINTRIAQSITQRVSINDFTSPTFISINVV